MERKLEPLSPPYTVEVESILTSYPKTQDGYLLKLFRVFANSVRFLKDKGVVNLLDEGSPLSIRQRELVILRVTANLRCEYEWSVHATVFAKAAGLTQDCLFALKHESSDASRWSEEESTLLACVDEICEHATIHDVTYAKFQRYWDLEQQLEILALCGNYHTVSFVANTSRLDTEEGFSTFPVR